VLYPICITNDLDDADHHVNLVRHPLPYILDTQVTTLTDPTGSR